MPMRRAYDTDLTDEQWECIQRPCGEPFGAPRERESA